MTRKQIVGDDCHSLCGRKFSAHVRVLSEADAELEYQEEKICSFSC